MGLKLRVPYSDYSAVDLNNPIYAIDEDSTQYIVNSGIYVPDLKYAIRTLVKDLKTNLLWDKISACWIFAGGSANACKLDLKGDPNYTLLNIKDTHISNGLMLNYLALDSPKFIDTGFRGNSSLVVSGHLSAYTTGTEVAGNKTLLHDVKGSAAYSGYHLSRSMAAGSMSGGIKGSWSGTKVVQNLESGLISVTQTNANIKIYSRGVLQGTVVRTAYEGDPSSNLTIGTPTTYYSARKLQFVSVGVGLNEDEHLSLSTIVQNYVTLLKR